MDEKIMVKDILNNIKLELVKYENIITQAENLELRQTLIQIRNNSESLQYELYKVAKMKDYIKPAEIATVSQIQSAKNTIQQ